MPVHAHLRGAVVDHLSLCHVARLRVAFVVVVAVGAGGAVHAVRVVGTALVGVTLRPVIHEELLAGREVHLQVPGIGSRPGTPAGPVVPPGASLPAAGVGIAVVAPEEVREHLDAHQHVVLLVREFRRVVRVALAVPGGEDAQHGRLGLVVHGDPGRRELFAPGIFRVAVLHPARVPDPLHPVGLGICKALDELEGHGDQPALVAPDPGVDIAAEGHAVAQHGLVIGHVEFEGAGIGARAVGAAPASRDVVGRDHPGDLQGFGLAVDVAQGRDVAQPVPGVAVARRRGAGDPVVHVDPLEALRGVGEQEAAVNVAVVRVLELVVEGEDLEVG